ncbi:MAG: right-handed parallel beta-helix repeat-containing protein [Myxococcota bacterium]|nr:right-handed parallel beta-helix repeat-containing protein [Myxococcota bacterium]
MKTRFIFFLCGCLHFASACDGEAIRQTTLDGTLPPSDAVIQPHDGRVSDEQNAGRLIFVGPGSSRVADGSRYAPFDNISDAYSIAKSGDTVLLLPGQYGAIGEPPPNVIVQGSGADVTSISGPWVLGGRNIVIRELSIQGGKPALRIDGDVLLETVAVTAAESAIEVNGTLVGRDLTITDMDGPSSDTRRFDGPRPSDGAAVKVNGNGQFQWIGGRLSDSGWTGVSSEGRITLTRVDVTRLGGPALYISGGQAVLSQVQINRVAVAGLLSTAGIITSETLRIDRVDPSTLIPLQTGLAMYGGEASLIDTEISGVNRGVRLSRGADLMATTLRITEPRIDAISLDGANFTGHQLILERPANTGLSAVNMSIVEVSDVNITDPGRIGALFNTTHARTRDFSVTGSQSRGLVIQNSTGDFNTLTVSQSGDVGIQITDASGLLTVSEATLVDNATTGIAVTGRTGDVQLRDIHVSATRLGDAGLAEGLHLFETSATLDTIHTAFNGGAGLLVEFSKFNGNGLRFEDNLGPGTVLIETEAETQLSGIVAERNRGSGILVLQGEAAINDFQIDGTVADLSAGPGDGINVGFGGTLRLSQGASDNNAGHGISVAGGCRADLTDVSAQNNGGYGLFYDCDSSRVTLAGETLFADGNRLGAQPPCQ